MRYPGGKGAAGVHQAIINNIPPHEVYIETHLGGGNIFERKKPAALSHGIDIDPAVIQAWQARAVPGLVLHCRDAVDFLEGYGLSETAHVGGNPAHAAKRQCLGIPLFNTDLRIIDPDTLRELGAGVVGEIVASGPQVFSGYWHNDEATRQAFVEIEAEVTFQAAQLKGGRGDLQARDSARMSA